jgi:hypothetical protein
MAFLIDQRMNWHFQGHGSRQCRLEAESGNTAIKSLHLFFAAGMTRTS